MVSRMWRDHRPAILVALGLLVIGLGALMVTVSTHAQRAHHPSISAPAPSLRLAPPNTAVTPGTLSPGSGGPLLEQGSPLVSPPSKASLGPFDAQPAPPRPATSAAYPPVPAAADADPNEYAKAWATEALSRDYATSTRAELLAWAQSQDALDVVGGLTRAEASKELMVSMTVAAASGGTATLVPSELAWERLAAEGARTIVSDVQVSAYPPWEQAIAAGFQASDPLMTMRQVSATVTQSATVDGHVQRTVESIAFDLALGSAVHHGGYGAMAVDYVTAVVD
jgi:hypothetical protein